MTTAGNGGWIKQGDGGPLVLPAEDGRRVPVKAWIDGIDIDGEGTMIEPQARLQLHNVATLPFVFHHVPVMPDVHKGYGATVGTVLPTVGAIIPGAVGVDIGCGMMAVKTSLRAEQLPDSLAPLRVALEAGIPHGFENSRDFHGGVWKEDCIPPDIAQRWMSLKDRYEAIIAKHPKASSKNAAGGLGSLGGGNHFEEVCIELPDSPGDPGAVWFMLHSGSRGLGNRLGQYFMELAREDMGEHVKNLPDRDLAYLTEGTQYFHDYVEGVEFGQEYAMENRKAMMHRFINIARRVLGTDFTTHLMAVNCHHNYVQKEHHFGQDVYVTRKGAVSARKGQLGIIPGSMGARSYIVEGLGNPESFHTCSHGAGRRFNRGRAKELITLDMHRRATEGVECDKSRAVLDESPMAYKDIDQVMAAQADLVRPVAIIKQVLCVKGGEGGGWREKRDKKREIKRQQARAERRRGGDIDVDSED
jgi:tRNA-splicing ligase RtcB